MQRLSLSALLALALLLPGLSASNATPFNLSTWTVIQYDYPELGSQDAIWSLSSGDTVATQSLNANPSIFLNDFDITSRQIRGTMRVNTSQDDDFIGFVFGYQGRGSYYLFDWKQATQTSTICGTGEIGMTLKIIDVSGGGDPTCTELWVRDGAGSGNVTVLRTNDIPWLDSTEYSFELDFQPGLFSITVSQGMNVVDSWNVTDSTYTSGRFGFYADSQGDVSYSAIPEPTTALLFGLGLAGLALRRRLAA